MAMLLYVLTAPTPRGQNVSFYAVNDEGNILECSIIKDDKLPATLSSRLSKETFCQVTGAHLTSRENIYYLNMKASVAKVWFQKYKMCIS